MIAFRSKKKGWAALRLVSFGGLIQISNEQPRPVPMGAPPPPGRKLELFNCLTIKRRTKTPPPPPRNQGWRSRSKPKTQNASFSIHEFPIYFVQDFSMPPLLWVWDLPYDGKIRTTLACSTSTEKWVIPCSLIYTKYTRSTCIAEPRGARGREARKM